MKFNYGIHLVFFLALVFSCDSKEISESNTKQVLAVKDSVKKGGQNYVFNDLMQSKNKPKLHIDEINNVPYKKSTTTLKLRSDNLKIEGWAFDGESMKKATDVIALVNGKPIKAVYGGKRPGVAKFYKSELLLQTGFHIDIQRGMLIKGRNEIILGVVSSDQKKLLKYDSSIFVELAK